MLYACLESIKLCLDAFDSIPNRRLFGVPYTTLTFLSHAIVVLSKLSLLRTKDWDHNYVQNTLNFVESIDRLIQKVNDAKALAQKESDQDDRSSLLQNVPKLFSMLPDTLRRIKAAHEAMEATQMSPSNQRLRLSSAEFDEIFIEHGLSEMPTPAFFDPFIEDFWQHITWP